MKLTATVANSRPVLLAAAIAFACASCGGKSSDASSDRHAVAGSPGPNVVEIVAREYAYQMPDTIPAGMTTLRLRNEGTTIHEAGLAKLDSGRTVADFFAFYSKHHDRADWARWFGGPGTVIAKQNIDVTMMLTPGTYVVLCEVPAPDGTEHVMKGMIKSFVVAPSARSVAAPENDESIVLVDYAFRMTPALTPGAHVLRVADSSSHVHTLQLMRFAPGKKLTDVYAWMEKQQGPSPVEWSDGIAAMEPGAVQYLTAHLTPGDYGILCLGYDSLTHKSHIALGMQQEFAVK